MSNDDFIKSLKITDRFLNNEVTLEEFKNYSDKLWNNMNNHSILSEYTEVKKRYKESHKLDNVILEKLQYSYYDNFVRYDGCPIGSDELVKFTPNNCKYKNGLKCDFDDRDCKLSVCPFKIRNLKENKIQSIKDEQNKQNRFIRKDIMNICVSIFENSGFATVQYKNKYLEVKDFDLDINSLKLSFLIDRDKFKHSIGDKVEKLNFEYSRGLMVLQNGDIIDISDVTYYSGEKYKKVVILFKSLDMVA